MSPPRPFLGGIAFVIRDYDEAIDWYFRKLGFELMEDTRLSETKRWVLIAPPGSSQTRLLLGPRRDAGTGSVHPGSPEAVSFSLHTDDFWRDYHAYVDRGVRFVREPNAEPYGTVAVFEDL